MSDKADRYGARVYGLDDDVILIKQTVKSGPLQNDDYVIDDQKEAHVAAGDDAAIAKAIRDALSGSL